MSNQILQWSMFIVPWLTLFFMKKEDIKRYMPVALFAVVLATIIDDVGIALGIWSFGETVFPFHQMIPYFYGLVPVLTMWVFKFTYGRFWVYMAANTILDIGFNFIFIDKILSSRGILGFAGITPLQGMPLTLMHAAVIYGFQIWQEGIFAQSKRKYFSPNLQPAVAKPLSEEEDNKNK